MKCPVVIYKTPRPDISRWCKVARTLAEAKRAFKMSRVFDVGEKYMGFDDSFTDGEINNWLGDVKWTI